MLLFWVVIKGRGYLQGVLHNVESNRGAATSWRIKNLGFGCGGFLPLIMKMVGRIKCLVRHVYFSVVVMDGQEQQELPRREEVLMVKEAIDEHDNSNMGSGVDGVTADVVIFLAVIERGALLGI